MSKYSSAAHTTSAATMATPTAAVQPTPPPAAPRPPLPRFTWRKLYAQPELDKVLRGAIQYGKRHFYTAPEHLEPLGRTIRESGIERDEFEIAVELGIEEGTIEEKCDEYRTTLGLGDLDYLILDVRKGNWNARWMEMDELLKSTDAMGVKAIGLDGTVECGEGYPCECGWYVNIHPRIKFREGNPHGTLKARYGHGLRPDLRSYYCSLSYDHQSKRIILPPEILGLVISSIPADERVPWDSEIGLYRRQRHYYDSIIVSRGFAEQLKITLYRHPILRSRQSVQQFLQVIRQFPERRHLIKRLSFSTNGVSDADVVELLSDLPCISCVHLHLVRYRTTSHPPDHPAFVHPIAPTRPTLVSTIASFSSSLTSLSLDVDEEWVEDLRAGEVLLIDIDGLANDLVAVLHLVTHLYISGARLIGTPLAPLFRNLVVFEATNCACDALDATEEVSVTQELEDLLRGAKKEMSRMRRIKIDFNDTEGSPGDFVREIVDRTDSFHDAAKEGGVELEYSSWISHWVDCD